MPQIHQHPNLPCLTVGQCTAALDLAGVPAPLHPQVLGITRMTLWKWKSGASVPHSHTLDRVSTLAYRCLRAVSKGHLPLPVKGDTIEYLHAMSDARHGVEPLDKLDSQTLLNLLPPQK